MDHFLIKWLDLLLEGALIWTDQFVELDAMLFLDWHFFRQQKFTGVDQVDVTG